MYRKSLVALIAAPLLGLIFLYVLNLGASLIPVNTLADKIENAFEEGSISEIDWPYIEIPGYNGDLGYNQFNDCLIYESILLRKGNRFSDASTSYVLWWWPLPNPTWKPISRCGDLRELVTSGREKDLSHYRKSEHR